MEPIIAIAALLLAAAAPGSVAAATWARRVLIVSAATANDAALAEQRRALAHWKAAAEARDLDVVEIVGDRVIGATDTAAMLRRRYRLPIAGFAAVLIGKDGGVKLRRWDAIPVALLQDVIDAMPMRRAGGR